MKKLSYGILVSTILRKNVTNAVADQHTATKKQLPLVDGLEVSVFFLTTEI